MRNDKAVGSVGSASDRRAARPPPAGWPAPPDAAALVPLPLSPQQQNSVVVLVVDDEETILESSVNVLEHEGYQVRSASRGSKAEDLLRSGVIDVAVIDLYMSGVSGPALLRAGLEARSDLIAIMMTGRPSLESCVEVLREGAWDYLPKPFSAPQLRILVGRAAHTMIVSREGGKSEGSRSGGVGDSGSPAPVPIGQSPRFLELMELAGKVARTDASVFITGESGSGKEMVAQYIHQNSRRRSREMVAVNCAALPEPLLESEMFGHVKGAFTGATRDKAGLMEAASGGTLFLDELIELSPMTQAKLLRVVQDGVVRRVGSSRTDAVVNVRFIAATNQDPAKAVEDGLLREDLFYRLGVVPIHVPPLRARQEDIPILAQHFVHQYWARHRGMAKPAPQLTDDVLRLLRHRPWKGNIRELQNVIEHAIVLAEGRDVIEPSDLQGAGCSAFGSDPGFGPSSAWREPSGAYHETRDRVLARFEKEYLAEILQETEGNVSEAARIAGVNRATLYRMLERHGLTKDDVLE